MLRIHTGLCKWTKKDQFHIILRDMNPLGIDQPCLTIANNEVLFEKYRISLKRDKDAIDIDGEDAINRNRLFFDFMLRMFDHLNQLYEMGKTLLIDEILTYHLRKDSDKENSSEPSPSRKESAKKTHQRLLHQGKRVLRKIHQSLLHQGKRVLRKIHQSLLLKKIVLRTRLTELFKQIVTPTKHI